MTSWNDDDKFKVVFVQDLSRTCGSLTFQNGFRHQFLKLKTRVKQNKAFGKKLL